MESRMIVMTILFTGQEKRHKYFGHSMERREWDDMRENH